MQGLRPISGKALAGFSLCFSAAPLFAQNPTATASRTWASVEEALGRKGAIQPGDVIKFSFPRSDLTVTDRILV